MPISETEIALFIQQYFLPFIRIGALFMAMPVLGTRILPTRARIVAASVIAVSIAPYLPDQTVQPLLSVVTLVIVLKEILIGVALGFTFQVVFQVFVLAGQFIAMKMGLGFASMNDPSNGVQTTVISQFYLTTITLMFVCINGHLVLLEMLINSFELLPIGHGGISSMSLMNIAQLGGWLFSSALVISLPILISLLIVNIAFGVMSRAAPQLNIFAVGFPFTLLCGLILMWLGFSTLSYHFDNVMAQGFQFIHQIIEVR